MMGPGGFNQMLQQAKKMQTQMKKLQDEMAEKLTEASSGGGMVKAVVNGKQELVTIEIKKEALADGDAEMVQDLVLTAVNEALRKSQEMVAREMSKLTGGMNIPGLF